MNPPPQTSARGGLLRRLPGWRVRAALVACGVVFAWAVAQFYDPATGFTSLISIGDVLSGTKVTALRQVPHYVYEGSSGYDGAYYAQLALHPTLENPELAKAIDNLPYRARRMLFCWVAWLLGLGQPAWIVQAHALLNVLCWFALAAVLLRWFPPTNGQNLLRWFGVMFSHGLCMSVRNSLVDGPSLLFVAVAIALLESGRRAGGGVVLALAGLGKETSLLAAAAWGDGDGKKLRTWRRPAATAIALALPLAAWMGYVRWKFGPADDPGFGNFTLPLAGFIEKWRFVVCDVRSPAWGLPWATLLAVGALGVQGLFFLLRWRPGETWWRVGAAFAAMMVFLSTPVWEGYPGAATRVLLPMTLAFNVLVPRGRRWLPVLLAGNLTVLASFFEFSPPHEFFQLRGDPALRAAVRVTPANGWHAPEGHRGNYWRWSKERAELRIANGTPQPVMLTVRGRAASASDVRGLRISIGELLVWDGRIGNGQAEIRFECALPPGESVLVFASDQPAEKVGGDPRELAFMVSNLEIVVQPAGGAR
ncbi:MAG: hypothetical protein HY736_22970 [Verrucomicrobia bacterium]|nr:hypothetical protein [Verrucomicrobiota bacterium]